MTTILALATRHAQQEHDREVLIPCGLYAPSELEALKQSRSHVGDLASCPHPTCRLVREPPPDWQPIETAPKNVLYMLLASPAHGRVIGAHISGDVWHLIGVGTVSSASERPTHWMPLPDPPVGAAPAGRVVPPPQIAPELQAQAELKQRAFTHVPHDDADLKYPAVDESRSPDGDGPSAKRMSANRQALGVAQSEEQQARNLPIVGENPTAEAAGSEPADSHTTISAGTADRPHPQEPSR